MITTILTTLLFVSITFAITIPWAIGIIGIYQAIHELRHEYILRRLNETPRP